MDDVFATHTDFGSQWTFIEEHLLPRLDWAKLKLKFKQIRIGCSEIVAVEVVHRTHRRRAIKPDRAAKLRKWPVPVDQKGVRAFLGSLGSLSTVDHQPVDLTIPDTADWQCDIREGCTETTHSWTF